MIKILRKWYPCVRSLISVVILIITGQVLYALATKYFGTMSLVDVRNPKIILFAFIYCIGVVLFTLFLHRVVDKRNWKDFGFRFGKKELLLTIISLVVSFSVLFIVVVLTKKWGITYWRWSNVQLKYIFSAAFLYLTVGLNEEFYFRGYLFKSLTRYGRLPAYVISGLIFVLIHFLQQPFSVAYLLELLLATFLFTYIYDLTGSIWPGVLLHSAVDLFLGMFFGSVNHATLIIWVFNFGTLSINELLMIATIIGDVILILLVSYMYKNKSKTV
ncbi:type II CAAX endopeptidase family protein [Mycoplasmatota bacterium zrk1]